MKCVAHLWFITSMQYYAEHLIETTTNKMMSYAPVHPSEGTAGPNDLLRDPNQPQTIVTRDCFAYTLSPHYSE